MSAYNSSLLYRIGVISINFVSAVVIIMANKEIMASYHFRLIVSLTAMHYITQTLLLELACVAGVFQRRRLHLKKDFKLLVLLVLGIGLSPILSNFSLLYNSVATYQFAKMLQTPSIVLGEWLWQGRVQSVMTALYLGGICVGVTVATVNDSLDLSLAGVLSAAAAIFLTALYKVGTAVAMSDQGWGSMQIMHAVFPVATAINICLAVALEGRQLLLVEWSSELILMIAFSCVSAFCVSWSQCLVVGACSALTHSLLGQAKTAVVIFWAWLFLSTPTNLVQIAGASISICCLMLYTHANVKPKSVAPLGTPINNDLKEIHSEVYVTKPLEAGRRKLSEAARPVLERD